jgi:hypothetical protein
MYKNIIFDVYYISLFTFSIYLNRQVIKSPYSCTVNNLTYFCKWELLSFDIAMV